MGLGVAARGMASALESGNIPFNIINFESGNYSRHGDRSWSHKEVRRSRYDTTIVCVNPDNSTNLRLEIPQTMLGDRYVISNWFWELPELPDEWLAEFELTDEVWAASQFIKDAVSRKSPVPVVLIPPVVRRAEISRFCRSHFGLPERRYLYLAMFDTSSVLERKNPLGVLRAFKKAFTRHDPNVALIMKFNNPDYEQPLMQALREEMDGQENVFVLDRILARDEVDSLIMVSDCFVSLHRSEGFGFGPAEAMSLGKPVVLTNWSGNTDYMTPENSVAINYELVSLGRDYGPYKSHQLWAEPDIDQAAHWMRRLLDEPGLAERIGKHASATIESRFSPEVVGSLIRKRLDCIRDNS